MNKLLAFDLGTGGNKAALFDAEGNCLASVFAAYDTFYPRPQWHEQKPNDWWKAVVNSSRQLLKQTQICSEEIAGIAVSGHSLGVVQLDAAGRLLHETTPIWSDSRAVEEAKEFFQTADYDQWYMTTGNGFPASHYPAFKLRWFRKHFPEAFAKTANVVGTKDYINYKLTGVIATDFSYASGSGVYDLKRWRYDESLIEAIRLPRRIFPNVVASAEILGTLTPEAANELGLSVKTAVVAGGVDNSCMAAGAKTFRSGECYASLGSSSWIAVSNSVPLLDVKFKPYIFAHVVPNQFASALAIFSSGTTFRWLRDTLCQNIRVEAEQLGVNPYELMIRYAKDIPIGANRLLMNPSLAGGSSLDPSPNIRGAFIGLDLSHTQADLIRAALEGIALNMRCVLDALRNLTTLETTMTVVGGGAISPIWRQIYADAMNIGIVKTDIDQNAAALGAAAIAAVGTGLWSSFDLIHAGHQSEEIISPIPENAEQYQCLLERFIQIREFLGAFSKFI
ncbi:MAG: FGGY-family carbohydrate kinase [Planctomycetaceae bacterium]|jgi:xylulokinase|nr:FGGY-family carbohydrate kinase [Planctomycetaceae bacterium]